MRIFRFADLATTPWKNGGGITREVLRHEEGGRMHWRVSIADVASDGAFSPFPGLQRILTVIDGKGMWLERPDGSALEAKLLLPSRFSGDEPIFGSLPFGPCRDFNVIFDPVFVSADVALWSADAGEISRERGETVLIACVSDDAVLSNGEALEKGDTARLGLEPVTLKTGKALLVRIRPLSKP